MEKLNVALGLIEQDGYYILQRRIGDAKIGAAGLIGCFGGKIRSEESAQQAVAREIAEETSLATMPEEWVSIGQVKVVSDFNHHPVEIIGSVFSNRLAPDEDIQATEGEIVRMTKVAALAAQAELTPATRAVFRQLL